MKVQMIRNDIHTDEAGTLPHVVFVTVSESTGVAGFAFLDTQAGSWTATICDGSPRPQSFKVPDLEELLQIAGLILDCEIETVGFHEHPVGPPRTPWGLRRTARRAWVYRLNDSVMCKRKGALGSDDERKRSCLGHAVAATPPRMQKRIQIDHEDHRLPEPIAEYLGITPEGRLDPAVTRKQLANRGITGVQAERITNLVELNDNTDATLPQMADFIDGALLSEQLTPYRTTTPDPTAERTVTKTS